MNVIIDGIEFQPVEQKVDKEREDAIGVLGFNILAHWNDKGTDCPIYELQLAETLYNAGYRKVGEEALFEDVYLYYMRHGVLKSDVDAQYTITKKVVK